MRRVSYVITRNGGAWAIERDGHGEGEYATKEAAFEAAVGAASNAIKSGMGVTIAVPPPVREESAVGGAP
jgi:hypothetical protein